MINAIQGIPGSGKSFEAVAFHVLPYLKQGRLVVTNLPLLVDNIAAINPEYRELIELRIRPLPIRGTWDPDRVVVDVQGNTSGEAFQLFEDGHTEQPPAKVRPFGQVWDYYHTWKDANGRGPIFIIDECHNAMPKLGTDSEVVQWYKLHRHFNADVLLMTQLFRDMCQEIAGLIGMMVKCRKADILGDSDSYIRKVHAGYRGEVISSEVRKYKPEIFGLYKSHTQGNSVSESLAQDVAPLSVKLRRFTRGFWLFTLLFSLGVGWWIYVRKSDKTPKTTVTRTVSVGPPSAVPGTPAPAPKYLTEADFPAVHQAAAQAKEAEALELEPLKGKTVHITGWLKGPKGTIYTFAVSGGGIRQFNLLAADLVASGYKWKPLGECMGYLTYEKKTRPVTCDAPALADGRENAPVVMDAGSGKRSDLKL